VTPWLAAAYGVLALGLGWSLAGGAPWARRLPFIVLAPPLALGLWLARPDPTGWPSTAGLPAHASLVSALVREPDPASTDHGRIYIWVDTGADAPRAFALPYSRSLHEQVVRALAHVARRQSVQVRRGNARGRGGAQSGRVQFVAGRPAQLPAKRERAVAAPTTR
jgi:hypothetical protein